MNIGVVFVDNKRIKALNKKYLGRDYATDVLSFNYLKEKPVLDDRKGGVLESSKTLAADGYLGDIVVSVEKAREQALANNITFEEEIANLVAHGVLHLLGIHHKGDNHEISGGFRQSKRRTQK